MKRLCCSSTMCFVLCMTFFIAGCNSGTAYKPVSGSVSYAGEPLKKGVITLYPNGEGTTSGCEIIDGKFSISKENGPIPGNYRVEIIAFKSTGKTEFDIDQQKEVDIEEQFLPKRYNRDSKLEMNVTSDGENVFDFDLDA